MQNILIVEDDPTTVELLKKTLQGKGYRVTAAMDGLEGIKAAQVTQFDLILLDIFLPYVDGMTFVKQIYEANPEKNPPIIVITSNDQLEEDFKFEGVKEYFVKPVDVAQVLVAVENIIGSAYTIGEGDASES